MLSVFRKKRQQPQAETVAPPHPFIAVMRAMLLEMRSEETAIAAEIHNPIVRELFLSAAKTGAKYLESLTPEQCEKACDFVNEINAKLCHARGILPVSILAIDSAENGQSGPSGTNGLGENDASAVSA